MEINVYDRGLNLLGVIDAITSLIWTRRYWACGEVAMLMPFAPEAKDLLAENNLIMPRGKREAAEIQHVAITTGADGMESIEVQGKLLPCWIGRRVVKNRIITTSNTQAIVNRIVRENVTAPADGRRKVSELMIGEQPDLGSGVIEYASEPYVNALTAISDAALAAKLGYRVISDPRAKTHAFQVYKGLDRTAGQAANKPCIFAQEFDNVAEQEFIQSCENYRNAAYVGGEQLEGIEQTVVEVAPEAVGLDRAEVYIDAADIGQSYYDDEGNQVDVPDAQYRAELAQRGAADLEQYGKALSFSSRIRTRANLVYGVDYDLGDRVTCINRRWGVTIDARITEVVETYQDNAQQIDVTFGESLPTLSQKIRQMAR